MTPEREAEMKKQMEIWAIMCRQRKGFNLTTDDPLFAPRKTIMPNARQRTLHCKLHPGGFGSVYVEHGVDFEFTGRIKYVREYGEFAYIAFELTWDFYERTWRTLWLKKARTFERFWVNDYQFEDMYPHKDAVEEEIVDC